MVHPRIIGAVAQFYAHQTGWISQLTQNAVVIEQTGPDSQDTQNARAKNGFIGDYVNLMESITDAPEEYHDASALFLISTAAGRNFVFSSVPDMNLLGDDDIEGRMLNLWFIFIGRSRISRKSTVAGHVESFVSALDPMLLLPLDFTPQALVKELAAKSNGTTTPCVWINDEISGFFQQLKDRTFMLTTDTVLSRLYDGRDYERTTIGRGLEKIPKPYLTFHLASTEYLPSLFDEGRLRQGFLNRFIYVVARRSKRKPLRTKLGDERKRAQALLEWLKDLHGRTNVVELEFAPDAKRIYDEYEEGIEDKISKEDLGLKEGYLGNLPNFLIRIASIFRISRLSRSELQNGGLSSLVVEKEDILRALDDIKRIWVWFEEVLHIMQTTATSRHAETEEYRLERILSIIRGFSDGDGWITQSEILRRSHLTSVSLQELLTTLEDRGDIESDRRPPSPRGGRPTTIYRVRRTPPPASSS